MTLAKLSNNGNDQNESPEALIERRVLAFREKLMREITRGTDDSIVAGMYVVVTASGNIRSGGIHLEPEYLESLIAAEEELMRHVLQMAASVNTAKAPVIPIKKLAAPRRI